MAGELAPFVRSAGLRRIAHGRLHLFESEKFVAAYAGMGRERALELCAAVWQRGGISQLISTGWCGALTPESLATTVQQIAKVIDGETGEEFSAGDGTRVLVTVGRVVDVEQKRELCRRFSADLVDMEAAHVARFALQRESVRGAEGGIGRPRRAPA